MEAAYKWFDRIFDSLAPFLYAIVILKPMAELLTEPEITDERRLKIAEIFKSYENPLLRGLTEIVEKGYAAMLPNDITNDIFGLIAIIRVVKNATETELSTFRAILEGCDVLRNKIRRLYRVDRLTICS